MLGVTSHCNIPDFKSSSKKVQDVLVEDRHPLAKLSRGALTATHATCEDGRWFMNDLRTSLERSHALLNKGRDDEAKDRPDSNRRGGANPPV